MIRRVVLIGLSGTGKSTTAQLVAGRLSWTTVDTDASIVSETGRSIPDIFRDDGEQAFRSIEAGIVNRALSREEVVVATGGGAVLDPTIWAEESLGHPSTLVVWLDAATDVLLARLTSQAACEGDAASRPLLKGDAAARFQGMREDREALYSRADVTQDVTTRTADDVADDVAELVRLGNGESTHIDLQVEQATSHLHIGVGVASQLSSVVVSRWPSARRVWAVIDRNVEPHVRQAMTEFGSAASFDLRQISIPPGESSKSLAGIGAIYDQLLGGGIERGDVVVAIGGGMVGDLAGFAAATVLRGVGLVQMPTTLLSMVDSSVGGKTGINHPAGKNLIGAFYQPSEVLIDPGMLRSLPGRELRSGWAEVIKHGVIEASTPNGQPPVLLDALERNLEALRMLKTPVMPWLIRRNVSLKASVVRADEREAGLRAILNFGHTIGHGVEAAGYSLLHGEAVAIGMNAALHIAESMDLVDDSFTMRIRNLISGFGLPLSSPADAADVRHHMQSDKKKSGGKQKWILPTREGGVDVRIDVPEAAIREAIAVVTQPLT